MSKIGEITYEIRWKWWTAPVFVVSELPLLRDWRWLQQVTGKLVIKYGLTLGGLGK